MKTYFILFFIVILFSCSDDSIKTGDEVFIAFSIKNENGERIDDNYLPNGEVLPLRVVVGNNYLLSMIEKTLIGKRKGDTINVTIKSKDAYDYQGVFYINNNDTTFIVKPNKALSVKLIVLDHLISKKQESQKY
jgi:FKBP-type peptidyl-prolyl cis-trans isomerase (trigger factor)